VGLQMREMILSAVEGRIETAAKIHRSLLPLFNAMGVVSNPVPIKYALNYIGFKVGSPRLPLVPPEREAAAVIEHALDTVHIDLPL